MFDVLLDWENKWLDPDYDLLHGYDWDDEEYEDELEGLDLEDLEEELFSE